MTMDGPDLLVILMMKALSKYEKICHILSIFYYLYM